MGRHPEILRAIHQPYFEAFPVFYSGVEMIDPSKAIWRYKSEEVGTQPYYYGNGDDQDFSEVVYDPLLSKFFQDIYGQKPLIEAAMSSKHVFALMSMLF